MAAVPPNPNFFRSKLYLQNTKLISERELSKKSHVVLFAQCVASGGGSAGPTPFPLFWKQTRCRAIPTNCLARRSIVSSPSMVLRKGLDALPFPFPSFPFPSFPFPSFPFPSLLPVANAMLRKSYQQCNKTPHFSSACMFCKWGRAAPPSSRHH